MNILAYIIATITIPTIIILFIVEITDKKNNHDKKITKTWNENKHRDWKVIYTNDPMSEQRKVNYFQPVNQYLPYRMITSVLTPREKTAYYIIFNYCTKNNLALFSKIRLADFITPQNTSYNRDFYLWFNKISAKHVDFLIVQQGSFRPLLAIEIDDTTHYRADRKERDIFVNNIYFSIGLPVLHLWDLSADKVEAEINNILLTVIK